MMDGNEGRVQQAGSRTKILFSPQPNREAALRRSLTGFSLTFLPFDTPGLDPEAYDIIVPLSLEWERWLNRSGTDAFVKRALFPSEKVIDLCDDKLAFSRLLVSNGFGNHVPAIGGNLGYPYVLKRRHDEWGLHTKVITGPVDEAYRLKALAAGDWLKQQFVPGVREYATHMLVAERQVVFACTLEYRFANDRHVHSAADRPIALTWVDHEHFYHLFARILGLLGYEGLCCIDYKLDRGTPKIFEVNPRMGGSLAYVGAAAMQSYRNAVMRRVSRNKPEACLA